MKKPQSIFALAFSFLSLVLLTNAAIDPVLDITGKKLRTGVNYYILPVVRGRGGGLTMGSPAGNKTCPLNVVQDRFEVSNGLPLTFSPYKKSSNGIIRVSTDLNVKFSAATICVQSTVWRLGDYDEVTKQWLVTIGGVEGNPGPQTVGNWFKIDKFGDKDYKIVFCPSVCNFCKVICRDVGIYIQDGKRFLALSDQPFRVMFKKAK